MSAVIISGNYGVENAAAKWLKESNCKAIIWDDVPAPNDEIKIRGAFPIWTEDKLEDVIKKWSNVFTKEAHDFVNGMKEEAKYRHHEKGMSQQGNMRVGARIPNSLYHILKAFYPEVLESPKAMMKLKAFIPIAFVGAMA